MIRLILLAPTAILFAQSFQPLPFDIQVDTLHKQTDPKWQWFHPRPAAMPGLSIVTLQKHLFTSDYYSGLAVMSSRDLGKTWDGPREIPELGWTKESETVDIAVADVTPGWHSGTRRLIAVGARVRYDKKGAQLEDVKRAHQTSYAVFDPKANKWSPWKTIEMPPGEKFNFARSACAQWLESDDGTVLLPFYFAPSAKVPASITVAQFRFDGRELKYLRHGSEHHSNIVRGYAEPSIVKFQGKYYLTVRNDLKGYVSVSNDGLQYPELREWLFDDGKELGSYNTQQHWLAHSDGLFLAYTRKGANNDHVFRHRAPLFLAQVDPASLRVVRSTERILLPERGATFGNFGAAAMTESESWVTDSEGMFFEIARKRGAEGATLLARVKWSKPNKAAPKLAKR